MLDRSGLKQAAKDNLKGIYGMAILMTFILFIINGIFGGSGSGSGFQWRMDSGESFKWLLTLLPFFLTLGFLGLAVQIFVYNPLELGYISYYIKGSRHQNPDISDMFAAFKSGKYINIVWGLLLRNLIVALGFILLIIPGIIFAYMYRFVPYILADNPGISASEALRMSAEMTSGRKWEMFVLDLSFLGWAILAMITCGIGFLFLQPYVQATWAELYHSLADFSPAGQSI